MADGTVLPCRFERLTLLKPIARGGMGEVFLAASGGIEGAERPCVVKIIRREHCEDKSFLARFFDEARIQAQLDHPGVAKILEAAQDPSGKPFVVVEYIEGRNLAEIRTRASQLNATLAWPEAVAVSAILAEALAHVHERTDGDGKALGIVHRDLSPQNVMIGYGGDVKLIDFGTARGENRRCHTVSGIVLAKPGYVAPEVANNNPGGIPADLYALGIILWELCAGRRFLTGDPQSHVRAVASGRKSPTAIAELVKAPEELDTIVARLTAPRVEDRYASAREAFADLVRALKKAPSLANGERGVRPRIGHLMERLYPAEPSRSRAELARLIAGARASEPAPRKTAPSPSPPAAGVDDGLFPGTRYRVVREIGRGAMGVVLEATHVDLGRMVALKVLPKERCGSQRLESRFRTEARIVARLRHENLVTLHDFGVSSDGRPYYAMELLDGESLDLHIAREKGMDYREALRIGVETCRALEAAHAAGLVHRDIKPGNLFLQTDQHVKLLDFGVAQAGEDVEQSESDSLRLLGTVEYMAPEQATGEGVDERADLYALGAVMYELVTGTLPHVAASAIAAIDMKLRGPLVAPSARAPHRGIPKAVDRVILRALKTDPKERFQCAAEMRKALEAALSAERRAYGRRRAAFVSATVLGLLSLTALLAPEGGRELRARAVNVLAPLGPTLGLANDRTESATPGLGTTSAPPFAVLYEAPASSASTKSTSKPDVDSPVSPDPAPADASEDLEPLPDGDAPETKLADSLRQELARASKVERAGNEIGTLNAYRRLAKKHPDEPEVLAAWSRAAIRTKGWGEALRAALQWASVDTSAPAQLHLAKVQRSVGQRYGAVATLERLLERQPDNADARGMLERYAPSKVALRQ